MKKIKIFSKTVNGKNKAKNQDFLFYRQNQYQQVIFAVADGVGDYEESKLASSLTCQILEKDFLTINFQDWNRLKIKNWIQNLIEKKIVPQLSKQVNKLATTLTFMLLINKNFFFIVHIGDTRICYLDEKEQKIFQLTQDHNFSSNIDDTFSWMKGKKFLQNCISNHKSCYVDVSEHSLKSGYYLLSSDGLHDFLDKKFIYQTLTNKKLEEKNKIKILFNKAIFSGSLDDISCILLKVT